MRRGLLSLIAAMAAGLAVAPAAHAELVGEFDVALKNFKPWSGGYTTVLNARVYDTTGATPARLQSAQIRFPRGATIRSTYVYGKFLCDTVVLEVTMNPATCRGSRFTTGTVVLDARPDMPDAVSTTIYLFLTGASIDDIPHGSVARVAAYVFGTGTIRTQVLYGTLFRDAGPYSLRLVLPTTIKATNPNLNLRLAELHLTNTGLTLTKPPSGRHSARKIFWTGLPRCSADGKLQFGIDYQFADTGPIAKQRSVKCSKFLRRPR